MHNLEAALNEQLRQRHEDDLYRSRLTHSGPQTPSLTANGSQFLAFCSNDYLGLANHPKLCEAATLAFQKFGFGSGASHLVVGHTDLHHQLEEELAKLTKRPRVLLFSSGYMANMGIISGILDRQDSIHQDRLNHASLLDGGLLSRAKFTRYKHTDAQDLDRQLQKSKSRRRLVATDGVFSMDGNVAPLLALSQVCDKNHATLMVDDAHGFGVLGPNGEGSVIDQGLSEKQCPIYMATLGKSMGSYGAFVAASDTIIETLIQFSRSYIYTTALPPSIAGASLASLKLLKEEPWRRAHLQKLIALFKQHAKAIGLPVLESKTAIQPIMLGSAARALKATQALKQLGILVTAIRPPTVPKDTARLRITLTAAHTESHIDQLFQALKTLQSQGILPTNKG